MRKKLYNLDPFVKAILLGVGIVSLTYSCLLPVFSVGDFVTTIVGSVFCVLFVHSVEPPR
jgi:hypothetical protein